MCQAQIMIDERVVHCTRAHTQGLHLGPNQMAWQLLPHTHQVQLLRGPKFIGHFPITWVSAGLFSSPDAMPLVQIRTHA